jgi:hypothetical protein
MTLALSIIQISHVNDAFYGGFSAISKSLGGQDTTSHGLGKLLYKYLSDCIKILPHLVLGTTILFLFKWILRNKAATLFYTLIVITLVFYAYRIDKIHSYDSNIKYLPLILFSFVLLSAKKAYRNTITILVLGVLLTQVAGSNTGLFLKMSYGMIAFLPVLIGNLYQSTNIWLPKSKIILFSTIQLCIILLLSFVIRWAWIYHVEDNILARFHMTTPINNNKLKGIYTTPMRSKEINETMNLLNSINLEKKDLLITNNDVLFYYLMDKKPITKDFWLSNYNNYSNIISEIDSNRRQETLVIIEDITREKNIIVDSLLLHFKSNFQNQVLYTSTNYKISEIKF